MNSNKPLLLLATAFMTSLLLLPVAQADDHKQEMLSEMWVMTPKAGHSDDLESAITEHLSHRQKMKDPRQWHVYSPVLGHNLNLIAVRAEGFSWDGMDSYRDWDKQPELQQHIEQGMDKYVSHYGHYLYVEDMENSHWGPDVEFRYVGVTDYQIKIGHHSEVESDVKAMSDAAKAANWPYHWAWSYSVSGKARLHLVVPYKNWSAMAPPDMPFAEVLAKQLGSEEKAKEMFTRWGSHFESIEYNIWARRDDLMPKAN